MIEIVRYRCTDGSEPFTEWLNSLRDKGVQAKIRVRLRRLEAKNFGDVKPVGEGVSELRIPVGPGYRVYCARRGRQLVILLCGGDKNSQEADVKHAKKFWKEWKKRQR
jgi:putative addiction module killer protein